jgi:DNA polymerase III subunit beta
MKATILQESLNKGLGAVGRIVASKGQLPVLANVLIEAEREGIMLSATNLELGLRVEVGGKVMEEGAITIPAKSLSEFINSLTGGNIELETSGDKLKVEGNKSTATFTGIAATEFPVMPKFGKQKNSMILKLDRQMIEEVATQVAFAAAGEESRPVLTGVQFKVTGEKLVVTATDGFRLSRKIIELKKELGGMENGLILPARTIMELARVSGEGRKEEVEMEIVKENNQVIFQYDNSQLISRILEGNFPEVEKIIPVDFRTQILIDKEELLRAVKAVAIFARESSNIMRFKVGDGEVRIEAAASQTGESEIEVEAQKEGEDGVIAFNYRYVLDFLNSVNEERLKFKMNGSLAPGWFGLEKKEDLIHIIMPVRV